MGRYSGTQYPADWLKNSTQAQRAAVPSGGVTWVDGAPNYDYGFYWSPGNPKPLADLKTTWIKDQKQQANTRLAPTDWMVIRAAEGGTAVPNSTKTYRAAVRTKCGEREATINACSTVDKLVATIRGGLAPTIPGTNSNGATERKKEDGSSYDPVQYNDIANPELLEAWPTEP